MEPTSEQALKRLLQEGNITEDEYNQLRAAINTPQSTKFPVSSEPRFEAYIKRVLKGTLITCSVIGLPAGLILDLPHVWILSILGIIVASLKLHIIQKQKSQRKD